MMKLTLSLIVSLLVVLAENATSAQNELDASLEVGSNGFNQPVATPDFAARNNLIYGLVSGGREFRQNDRQIGDGGGTGLQLRSGNLVAPGTFRDVLGSDDLFRFRARSLSFSQLDQFGVDVQNLRNEPVYSGVPPVSAGHVTQDITGALVRQDISSELLIPMSDAASRGTAKRYHTMRSVLDTVSESQVGAGVVRAANGQLFDLEATPLRGLRPVARRAAWQDLQPASAEDADAQTPDADDTTSRNQIDSRVASAPTTWAPSVEIGMQIMAAVDAVDMDKFKQRAEDLENSLLLAPRKEETEVGDDVFADLLKQIELGIDPQIQDLDEGLNLNTTDEMAPIDPAPKGDGPDPVTIHLWPELKLKDPGMELIQQAAAARRAALRSAQGLAAEPDDGDAKPDQDHALLPPALNKLVTKLNYDLPRLETMAGNTDSEVNKHFRKAEEHMATGKYFLAENSYQQILQFKSGHELAGTGLIHAQLGAAMIRSAARNLRRHFVQHPQLIATRYQSTLLPSQKRLEWVASKLHNMVKQSKRTAPPLMLAYLGYQTGSSKLVRYGLDVAQSRDPLDPLVPLLRRIWLEEPTKAGQATEPDKPDPVSADEPAQDEPDEPRTSQ